MICFPSSYLEWDVGIPHQSKNKTIDAMVTFNFTKTKKVSTIFVHELRNNRHRFWERQRCSFGLFHRTWDNNYSRGVLQNTLKAETCCIKQTTRETVINDAWNCHLGKFSSMETRVLTLPQKLRGNFKIFVENFLTSHRTDLNLSWHYFPFLHLKHNDSVYRVLKQLTRTSWFNSQVASISTENNFILWPRGPYFTF